MAVISVRWDIVWLLSEDIIQRMQWSPSGKWMNYSPCKAGISGSMPSFSSLSPVAPFPYELSCRWDVMRARTHARTPKMHIMNNTVVVQTKISVHKHPRDFL